MATVRPPRNGPMQRQRISEKSFSSNCCALAEVEKIVATTIPAMNHFPAEPIRIRVLREKKEDTLAAGMEQRDAGVGSSKMENRKWKFENRQWRTEKWQSARRMIE
jgi:hypothetical protein